MALVSKESNHSSLCIAVQMRSRFSSNVHHIGIWSLAGGLITTVILINKLLHARYYMAIRFTGSLVEIKEKLASLSSEGEWRELNQSQYQFRHHAGGILNWYVSTGTIQFQGRFEARQQLEASVAKLLGYATEPIPSAAPASLAVNPTAAKSQFSGEAAPVQSAPKADSAAEFLLDNFSKSELVIGLVSPVGTDLAEVIAVLKSHLQSLDYSVDEVRVSKHVIPEIAVVAQTLENDECARINAMMDAGNAAREINRDSSILALGVAAFISSMRNPDGNSPQLRPKKAYIINSLKHPSEVSRLRSLYPEGFYLLGVYADERRRHKFLTERMNISAENANQLIRRDASEVEPHGQRTTDTFHLSDFFIHSDGNNDKLASSLFRILDILFGHPYKTPTFDEYAMFMAHAAALRSSDLSRQVGAVVARDNEILSTGANDCPKFGGGLYWPEYDAKQKDIVDAADGRDYMRGEDANKAEQVKIIEGIVSELKQSGSDDGEIRAALKRSRLSDITEFGRMVHAEMEALLALARNNVSSRDATVFCTTFPCHNCAKHIVAAGIVRVVYIEPYPKSKAAEFHTDSIQHGLVESNDGGESNEKPSKVRFEPFVGIGPRRFFDLFSMSLGSGYRLERKDPDGQVLDWIAKNARLRTQMLPWSYLQLELIATDEFGRAKERKEQTQ